MMDKNEPFELIQLLGTGGFAQTWSARMLDPELVEEYRTREVAVKIPLTKQKGRVLKKELQLTGSLRELIGKISRPPQDGCRSGHCDYPGYSRRSDGDP
jgi:hypothetical protein